MTHQSQKAFLTLALVVLTTMPGIGEIRTWTFVEDGRINSISFKKNGRIDAEYVRLDGTNVVLILKTGDGTGSVPLAYLCETDRTYVDRANAELDREAKAKGLLAAAEIALRKADFSKSVELLNEIAIQFPGTAQARTISGLTKFLKEKDVDKSGPLSVDEGRRLKKMRDNLEDLARNYHSTTPEKHEALDSIFGPATFIPPFDLESTLDALTRLAEAREKAIRGANE